MNDDKEIVILTAAYDDWQSVMALLELLDKELTASALLAKVVVVDDGSPTFADPEPFAALKLRSISQVDVITLSRNLGNQRAVAIGVGYVSAEMPCDFLVIMDSDLEDNPEYVPQLIAAAEETGNEIVFAERIQRSEGTVFKVFYGIYKYLYRLLVGMPISIGNFSAIPGRLVRRVASISEIWSHFPAGIMRARVPFTKVPTIRGKRLYGRGKSNFVALVVHGLSGFAVHADVVGVRIVIAIFGLGIVILAAIFMVIAKRLLFDFYVLGWTSLVVIILGIAVLQTFVAAIFMAFLILSGKNHRMIIPAADYGNFILEVERMYPSKGRTIPKQKSRMVTKRRIARK